MSSQLENELRNVRQEFPVAAARAQWFKCERDEADDDDDDDLYALVFHEMSDGGDANIPTPTRAYTVKSKGTDGKDAFSIHFDPAQ